MGELGQAFSTAGALIGAGDSQLVRIVLLSLRVSLTAVAIAALVGLPLGALVAVARFPGRAGVVVALNALMGLPPVVVGLLIYLLLSRSGPLGVARSAVHAIRDGGRAGRADRADPRRPVAAGARGRVVRIRGAAPLPRRGPGARCRPCSGTGASPCSPCCSRASAGPRAEVGAVMMVGGNIDGFTRVMTTAIALETSKGDLPLALALGVVLMAIVLAVNALRLGGCGTAQRAAG